MLCFSVMCPITTVGSIALLGKYLLFQFLYSVIPFINSS